MLGGVVHDDVNRRAVDFLEARDLAGTQPPHEPTELLAEDWFVDGVILNRQAAGAVRSLLGGNFGTPILVSNHDSLVKTRFEEVPAI